MKMIKNNEVILYQCEECGFQYLNREWAEKCEAWCKKHNSCHLDIIKHAITKL